MAGYGDDSGFTAYANAAGYTVPAGNVANARQRGSDYIDAVYGPRFPGRPTGGAEQERAWPRTGASAFGSAIGENVIPVRVVSASYEAALLELQKPGVLSRTFTPGEQKVLTEVKGIKWQVVAGTGGKQGSALVSTKIEGLLDPLLLKPLPAAFVV